MGTALNDQRIFIAMCCEIVDVAQAACPSHDACDSKVHKIDK